MLFAHLSFRLPAVWTNTLIFLSDSHFMPLSQRRNKALLWTLETQRASRSPLLPQFTSSLNSSCFTFFSPQRNIAEADYWFELLFKWVWDEQRREHQPKTSVCYLYRPFFTLKLVVACDTQYWQPGWKSCHFIWKASLHIYDAYVLKCIVF